MTDFKIHFRGVALMVANPQDDNRIMEVLFPRTDLKPQDGHEATAKNEPDSSSDNPGDDIDVPVFRHADGGPARRHFAGAAVIGPGEIATYHNLTGRCVRLVSGGIDGAKSDIDPEQAVFLNNVIVHGKELALRTDHDDSTRIATRFFLDGGDVAARQPSKGNWHFDSTLANPQKDRNYCLDCLWTIPASGKLEFSVGNLDTGSEVERITLDAEHTDVFFYNFDIPMPTLHELTTETLAQGKTTDHDFKWIYNLLKPVPDVLWPKWLGPNNTFPAPVTLGLVDVSTCFWTVWNGASE